MDVTTTRQANLKVLVESLRQRGHRTNKEIAVQLDMSASYMSQLLGGKKMGDDVARKLELAQDLSHGWMDVVQGTGQRESLRVGESEVPYSASQSLRLQPETIAASIKLVRLTFEILEVEFDPEDDGVPLAFAYEYLSRRRETKVTPENLVDFRKALAAKLQEKESSEDNQRTGVTRGAGGSDRGQSQRRKAS